MYKSTYYALRANLEDKYQNYPLNEFEYLRAIIVKGQDELKISRIIPSNNYQSVTEPKPKSSLFIIAA